MESQKNNGVNNLFVKRFLLYSGLAIWSLLLFPSVVFAHGFGERYDLPIPLNFYLFGGGFTVFISFIIIAAFKRKQHPTSSYPTYTILQYTTSSPKRVRKVIEFLSLATFVLIISTGLFGNQNPTDNLTPTFIWIIWWVGFTIFTAFWGNLWPIINPFAIVYDFISSLYFKITNEDLSFNLPYPKQLGIIPALILFVIFVWFETIYPESGTPSHIAVAIICYLMITFTGMLVFGKTCWLEHGEVFSILFYLLSLCSITEIQKKGHLCQLRIRPLAAGLINNQSSSWGRVVFIMIALGSVSFDGFSETPLWVDITIFSEPFFRNIGQFVAINSVGLLVCIIIFLIGYLFFALLMNILSGSFTVRTKLTQQTTYSLLPIAVGYLVAHYLSFLIIQGQLLIPLISDPFGWEWNLLGTGDYVINIAIINARFAWILSLITIVTGHILAVFCSHSIALQITSQSGRILLSQLPMLVLMILYTMTSLWIIAQPIVEYSGT